MQMLRRNNWRGDLNTYIKSKQNEPFAWGTFDCALWAASCVEVITGINVIPDIAGSYKNLSGAKRCLTTKLKVKTVDELCEKLFGERMAINWARAGDIVIAPTELVDGREATQKIFGDSIGISNGIKSYFASPKGLIELNTYNLVEVYQV